MVMVLENNEILDAHPSSVPRGLDNGNPLRMQPGISVPCYDIHSAHEREKSAVSTAMDMRLDLKRRMYNSFGSNTLRIVTLNPYHERLEPQTHLWLLFVNACYCNDW